mmetsp:Transcript_2326/g.8159  ORF Transcript_2326/g.8159 Transcript_2326/m.8159 type:complete len:110 (-) Transcript_2326:124-453(-)
MPLVKVFARSCLNKAVPLTAVQAQLCTIWGTTPSTTKLILTRVEDWTGDTFNEDLFVDIRAKAKPERTRERVLESMGMVREAFAAHGLVANVRLQTYAGEDYFHLPPDK